MAKKKGQFTFDVNNLKYFPIGSDNVVRNRFIYGTDIYIEVRSGFTYKVFIVNEDNPEGKKYCESKNEGDILNKIPHYWN